MENNSPEMSPNNNMKIILPIVGVAAIAILGYMMTRPSQSEQVASPSPTTSSQPVATTPAAIEMTETTESSSEYKNGTYDVVGTYTSPGGEEELGVTLTLVDGVVTASEVEVLATRPISVTRQEDFIANYEDSVIGKNIADLELGKISGSSLTPLGFNDAVEKIKVEAQS